VKNEPDDYREKENSFAVRFSELIKASLVIPEASSVKP